jgi:hypothetical protein
MKKTLVVSMVVVASIVLTAGVVKAASAAYDSLTVGSQGVGGVTFFNGSIQNSTTTNSADNPVTFADNVRIDGRVFRGVTAGTSDTLPFIVNDNMEVEGDLTVNGDIAYDNTNSGLASTTVQGAIDELATTLSNAISGGDLIASSGVEKAALTATTWVGHASLIEGDGVNGVFTTTPEVTVIFTPTTESEGTYVSSPINAFQVTSMGESDYCEVGLTGNYKIVGDKLFVYGMDMEGLAYSGQHLMQVNLRGNTMELYKTDSNLTAVTYLTRQ